MTAERRSEVRSEVCAGVSDALEKFMTNDESVKKFWRKGFEELSSHSANGASQWVGKRILTALIVAITSACLVYLARSGKL